MDPSFRWDDIVGGVTQWVSSTTAEVQRRELRESKTPTSRETGVRSRRQCAYFSMVTASKYGTFSGERQKPFT